MYIWFVLLDLATLAVLLSMLACVEGSGDAAYVSEWIYQCKHSAGLHVLPWIFFALFAAVVFWQLAWMYRVARAHEHGACAAFRAGEGSATAIIVFSCVSVVGAWAVIHFEIHSENKVPHRLGVIAMAFGFFVALHIVWAILRTGESTERLLGQRRSAVPVHAWFPYDVLFVAAIALFMLGAFLPTEIPHAVSVAAEYAALSLLFLQTFWLFLACCKRDAETAGPCAYAMDAFY
jgi:hypothetical protein